MNREPIFQFGIALGVFYLLLRYVPGGITIGLLLLAGVILSTPQSVQSFSNLLAFIGGYDNAPKQ